MKTVLERIYSLGSLYEATDEKYVNVHDPDIASWFRKND